MSEWINIEEMMPQDDQRVLACLGGDVFLARYFGSKKGWRRDPDMNLMQQAVMYWMPIPELPKK